MVDNRTANFFGIPGGFNFKSGDISGTAANLQDDKMGSGSEYGAIPQKEEFQDNQYVDRSAQLRATLNSLAMMNVAKVLNERKKLEKSFNSSDIENSETDEEEIIDNIFDEEYYDESNEELLEHMFDEIGV